MRIGILTYHFAHNYGAILQCYALQTYLTSLGHDVSVIDYKSPAIEIPYKPIYWRRFVSINPLKTVRKCLTEIQLLPFRIARYKAFNSFIQRHLNLAPVEDIINNPFDCIIVGSDQVWNTQLTKGYDHFYWGLFDKPQQTRLITYAVSMEDNPSARKCMEMSRYMSNFSAISVRENALAETLSNKFNTNISCCVDPTLLLSAEQWGQLAGKRIVPENYVLLYEVNPSEKAEQMGQLIANKMGLRLITLSSLPETNREAITAYAMPNDFLNLFQYASFVVASSFHGTVFALLFKKPFVSLRKNDCKDERVKNLLNTVNMLNRFIDTYNDKLIEEIVSAQINITLDTSERKKSILYLNSAISQT